MNSKGGSVCNYSCSTELGELTLGYLQACFVVISDGILNAASLGECCVSFIQWALQRCI